MTLGLSKILDRTRLGPNPSVGAFPLWSKHRVIAHIKAGNKVPSLKADVMKPDFWELLGKQEPGVLHKPSRPHCTPNHVG